MRKSTGILAVERSAGRPDRCALEQNYPNPFNPSTTIASYLPEARRVRIAVYDILGREICLLVDEHSTAGRHTTEFRGDDLGSGVYFCRMDAGDFRAAGKMLLTR